MSHARLGFASRLSPQTHATQLLSQASYRLDDVPNYEDDEHEEVVMEELVFILYISYEIY